MGSQWSSRRMNPSDISWDDIPHPEPTVNGLILSGTLLPEELLELVFSYFDAQDLESVTKVCSLWKTVTTRRSFWKAIFERNNLDWSLLIPQDLFEKKNFWCLLHLLLKRNGFKNNLVLNGSGEQGLNGWELNGEYRYEQQGTTENPPVGCDGLDSLPNSCFVTSYMYTTFTQVISLGVTDEMLEIMCPFQVEFSIQICARFDCGGKGNFTVAVHEGANANPNTHQLINHLDIVKLEGQTSWEKFSFAAYFDGTRKYRDPHFSLTFGGKDTKFWAGFYGLKFSRITAKVKLLSNAEVVEPIPEYPRTVVQLGQIRG